LISLVSILCISILFNGSRIFSEIQFRTQILQLMSRSVFKFWTTISHIHCIRMFADLFSRKTNSCSLSFWQWRFYLVTIK
jgi:hypothetical protein